MAEQAGQLLIVRQHLVLDEGITTVDTGIKQVNRGVEPPVGGSDPTADADGVASRVEVKPLAPLGPWVDGDIHHGEPYLDATTGTIKVDFWVTAGAGEQEINVLFWDPHTLVTPMDAVTYNEFTCVQPSLRSGSPSPTQGGNNGSGFPDSAGNPFNAANPANADGQLVIAMFAMHAFVNYADPGTDPVLTDAGWTTLLTGGFAITGAPGTGMKFIVAYRISDIANDPAFYGFDAGGAGWRGAAILSCWVPATSSAPIQSSAVGVAVDTETTPLVLQAPSLIAPDGALPTLLCGYIGSQGGGAGFTSNAGMTNMGGSTAHGFLQNPGVYLQLFREFVAAPGATGTKQATWSSVASAGIAFSIALPPLCGIFPDGSGG